MNELLALLSPGAVMAFLMASVSMWVILQVAKQDANYSVRMKTFLLILAWPIFTVGLLVFMGLLVLSLLPVAQQYSIEIPNVSIDPSLFVLWGLTALFLMTFSYIYSFFLRKMHRWLPKSEAEKDLERISNKITEVFKGQNDLVDRSIDLTKDTVNLVTETRDVMKSYKDVTESYRSVSDGFDEQLRKLDIVTDVVVEYIQKTSRAKKEAESKNKKRVKRVSKRRSPSTNTKS